MSGSTTKRVLILKGVVAELVKPRQRIPFQMGFDQRDVRVCVCVRVCLCQLNSTRIGKHTDEPTDREAVSLGADQEELPGYMACRLSACFPSLTVPQLTSRPGQG